MKNRRFALLCPLAAALVLPAAACTVTPDPCVGWAQACLAVTVENGPPDTYQLLVAVLDGYGSTTPVTPRQQPHQPLVYPLRFAIRFEEFDRLHKGAITFTAEALDQANDVLGYVQKAVAIAGYDHQHVTVSLGGPADLGSTDLATSDFSRADGPATDLPTTPDMP